MAITKPAAGLALLIVAAAPVLVGCNAGPTEDVWIKLPQPSTYREVPIQSVADLVGRSSLVVEGEIIDVAVRERGVWSEPQGPDDIPIYAQDIVLTVLPTGEKNTLEVRIERLYDDQPGSGPLSSSGLSADAGSYIFALVDDELPVVKGGEGVAYRCTDEEDFCGLQFVDGVLYTTARSDSPARPVSALLDDASSIKSFDDLEAIASEEDVESRG
jgi:hypothetical protein